MADQGGGGGAPGTSAPSRSNFFHFDAVLGKYLAKQECIPVGCVQTPVKTLPSHNFVCGR